MEKNKVWAYIIMMAVQFVIEIYLTREK